jgi:hypothetical protein
VPGLRAIRTCAAAEDRNIGLCSELFSLGAQAPPLTLLTVLIVAGVVVGVMGHIVHARPLILLGILVVGAVCGYVVVSSYLGAFG